MKKQTLLAIGFALIANVLLGCGADDGSRTVNPAESKAADVKRQSFIDNNSSLSPEQKAMMKSHMGGPPASPSSGRN